MMHELYNVSRGNRLDLQPPATYQRLVMLQHVCGKVALYNLRLRPARQKVCPATPTRRLSNPKPDASHWLPGLPGICRALFQNPRCQ
jgi:hypothetical protein